MRRPFTVTLRAYWLAPPQRNHRAASTAPTATSNASATDAPQALPRALVSGWPSLTAPVGAVTSPGLWQPTRQPACW